MQPYYDLEKNLWAYCHFVADNTFNANNYLFSEQSYQFFSEVPQKIFIDWKGSSFL